MPLVRTYFNVYLDDPDTPDGYVEYRVEIRGVDQLRAELEGKRMGVGIKDAMHQTFLWSWAALCRTGEISDDFATFKGRAIKVEGDGKAEDVDPTPPAVTAGLPSPSPSPLVEAPPITPGGLTV